MLKRPRALAELRRPEPMLAAARLMLMLVVPGIRPTTAVNVWDVLKSTPGQENVRMFAQRGERNAITAET